MDEANPYGKTAEEIDRSNRWFRIAVALGKQDDFVEMLETERKCGMAASEQAQHDEPVRAVIGGWGSRSDHGSGVLTLHYPDGTIRIEHRCKTVGDLALITAPALSPGHEITQAQPLTITPSILCPDCGLHGYITNGAWVAC